MTTFSIISLFVALIAQNIILLECYQPSSFNAIRRFSPLKLVQSNNYQQLSSDKFQMSDNKPPATKEPPKYGVEKFKEYWAELQEIEKENKPTPPPFYNPGPYQIHLLAALAYVIPLCDVADLGKYMFEAYPKTGEFYNIVYGPLAAIYNGVPFLPFAIFFLMSYISRAPTFPVEVRFHFSQAFIVSLIQFLPSILFGFLEKAGVPGMGIWYNTVFLWVVISCLTMQVTLLNPLSKVKNPFILNILGWSLRYMNFTSDMAPK